MTRTARIVVALATASGVVSETATAVADLTCQAELGYPRLYAEVSAELQQAFYDDHRTDLEAWLAAIQEWEAGQ